MSTNDTLNVLSFNCWGLAVVAKHREFRLRAIAKALEQQNCDIITLQEVWVQKDFEYIQETVKQTLPHTAYFYSGALGSGLAILSRFPIISTTYHRYALNGKPLKFWHGDYYVGKGVGSALVDHPTIGLLEIFNTHLHAGYGPKNQYKAHRATECWQLANILRQSAAMGRQIVMSGDFNSVPSSFNYRLIRDHGFMSDSWLQLHGEPDADQFDMDHITPDAYTQYFGFTCNSPYNTFSRYYDHGDSTNAKKLLGKRLDYIFYRHSPQLTCIESKVVLTGLVPDSSMSFSDHFGVVSIFSTTQQQQEKEMAPIASLLCHPNYTHLQRSIIQEILDELRQDQDNAKIVFYILIVVLPTTLSYHGPLPVVLITVFDGALMNLTSLLIPVLSTK
ncbi:DNase I-like protein [Mucor ambiguus]|uniref:DNase I-like protein n=1 Tax=Mucor ambiguus TaxID=91626 RepID=A0A0C9MFV1_9FUNG|nr:DNase I-like protein [Mucor ambiguus]